MGDIAWLDANDLAAGQVNSQAITSSYQYLQVGSIAIEWSLTVLANTAIDDDQVGFDAAIHINNGLSNPKSMHGPPVRARQNTHQIFHAQSHSRDNMRFEHRQVDQASVLHEARNAEVTQALCPRRS